MGWGRMLLLGDVGQQMDIHESREEMQGGLAQLRSAIKDQRQLDLRLIASDLDQHRQIESLKLEVEALELCVATLAKLLRDKGVASDAELVIIASLIDLDS